MLAPLQHFAARESDQRIAALQAQGRQRGAGVAGHFDLGHDAHTAMLAGPMMRKGDIKSSAWIAAYERRNVLIGLGARDIRVVEVKT